MCAEPGRILVAFETLLADTRGWLDRPIRDRFAALEPLMTPATDWPGVMQLRLAAAVGAGNCRRPFSPRLPALFERRGSRTSPRRPFRRAQGGCAFSPS
jgi:hypothetical protein